MLVSSFAALVVGLWVLPVGAVPSFDPRESGNGTRRKTKVAILGGGVAGITAAQALVNQTITDFLIVEYNSDIGGRMKHTPFGADQSGDPYTVELGANWIQGLGTKGGPENPIWTFGKKYNISNTYSDYESILTYNETGATDFEQAAGTILSENLQDRSFRAGLSQAGWKPTKNMAAQAVEWWEWDFETSYPPDESSFVFGITGYNLTFYQFSDENNLVTDPRGFNHWLKSIASTFLKTNDTRLLLNTIVTDVHYTDTSVLVNTEDGGCIEADYAICTFPLGVLQNDAVTFHPEFPEWKDTSIATFQMGTYTKRFFQFNETFWDPNTQYFLYASPTMRGYYPVWQSLSTPGFLPDSNIIFVTVVGREAYRVEAQSEEVTKAEALKVLAQMFPDVDMPEPTAFLYPRWSTTPWSYGSYSNWPVGTTLETHQNLRANIGRLYFAGEHTSTEYFGFLHGAGFEGREARERIAGVIAKGVGYGTNSTCRNEAGFGDYVKYEVLHGTTELFEYNALNGMGANPFYAAGS